ncbi:MAG: ABC transporter substrate-binding protein [Nocardioides sp.]|uniref:ABC transporter substrate-binding protein n=1 Tax=Nocardioides sp. TaxID=35761 RepID=UPI0039E68582
MHNTHPTLGLSRRSVLGLSLGGTAALLMGCGAQTSSSSPTGSKIVKGGTLTFAEQQPPSSLNPGILDHNYTDFSQLAYDPLLLLDSDGSVKPRLATSYKFVGKGNTRLDLTLRSGVTFCDGDALDAAAVKASLEYVRDGKGAHAALLEGMTFAAVDKLTVSIRSSTPNPALPTLLTQKYPIGQVISPTGLANPQALSITGQSHGAGPYVYNGDDSVAGDHYTYEANPSYYDTSQQYYDKVVIRIIADSQAALNAAKTGQVALFKGNGSMAAQAKSAGLQIVANPAIMTGVFLIDRGGEVCKPLGDVRVRQAINYALDRDSVTSAVFGSYGVETDETIAKGGDGYSAGYADYYSYDVDKAKQLLGEAGYPDGFELKLLAASFAGFDQVADAVKGQLAKIGINCTVDVKSDLGTYTDDATNKTYPAWVGGYDGNTMYQQGLDLFMPGSQAFNGFGSRSKKLETLWHRAAAADETARAKLDQQMQEYLVKNAWFAPIAFAPVIYFAADDLGGVATSVGAPYASPLMFHQTA